MEDRYSRVDYRRLVAWPQRIDREWPFLQRVLGTGGRVLDLGSGTGEHSRFLASKGFDVIGIDSSPTMIEKAMDTPLPANLRFIEGDIADVGSLVDGTFDGAICLGNTLPHLTERGTIEQLVSGLRRRLRPGAAWLLQVLNYDRVFEKGQRFLPLNFREDDAERGAETVFLRLMTPRADGTVVFTPSTLRYRPDAEPPLEVVSTRSVYLHGWRRAELEEILAAGGFSNRTVFGTVGDAPFVPTESNDTVIVAR
ncbi:MAG TPA: class I SAM-dependent methyltransferase [Vicinamibacterales bacterium]